MESAYYFDMSFFKHAYRAGGQILLNTYATALRNARYDGKIADVVHDELSRGSIAAVYKKFTVSNPVAIIPTSYANHPDIWRGKSIGDFATLEAIGNELRADSNVLVLSDDKFFRDIQNYREIRELLGNSYGEFVSNGRDFIKASVFDNQSLLDQLTVERLISSAERTQLAEEFRKIPQFNNSSRLNAFATDAEILQLREMGATGAFSPRSVEEMNIAPRAAKPIAYGLGGALQIGFTVFDIWNNIRIAQQHGVGSYESNSALARSVPTELGIWGSTVYGASKAYQESKTVAATLEGGLRLASRWAAPAMAAGTVAEIGYGIHTDKGFGPHAREAVYNNHRALLGAGVGGVVGAVGGLGVGALPGAEIGFVVGSFLDLCAAIIGEENVPSWGTVAYTISSGMEPVLPAAKVGRAIVDWLTSPAESGQSSSSESAGQNAPPNARLLGKPSARDDGEKHAEPAPDPDDDYAEKYNCRMRALGREGCGLPLLTRPSNRYHFYLIRAMRFAWQRTVIFANSMHRRRQKRAVSQSAW